MDDRFSVDLAHGEAKRLKNKLGIVGALGVNMFERLRRRRVLGMVCFLSVVCAGSVALGAEGVLECRDRASRKAFPLVDQNKKVAVLCIDSKDAKVVQIAAGLLSEDIERVTGIKPNIINESVSRGK